MDPAFPRRENKSEGCSIYKQYELEYGMQASFGV